MSTQQNISHQKARLMATTVSESQDPKITNCKATFTISSNKYLSSLRMSGQKSTDTIGTEANVRRLLRSAWSAYVPSTIGCHLVVVWWWNAHSGQQPKTLNWTIELIWNILLYKCSFLVLKTLNNICTRWISKWTKRIWKSLGSVTYEHHNRRHVTKWTTMSYSKLIQKGNAENQLLKTFCLEINYKHFNIFYIK